MVMPGDITMDVELIIDCAIEKGLRFLSAKAAVPLALVLLPKSKNNLRNNL